jgi:hypothetical protein
MLGVVLILLGITVAVAGAGIRPPPIGIVAWRGAILLTVATLVFGFTVRGLGLAPACALSAFIGSYASRQMTLRIALAITLGLTIFCVLLFSYGLGLPLRIIGPWLVG